MNQDLMSNRYDALNQIGQGGQGTVYVARSKQTGENVAVKIIQLTPQNQTLAAQEAITLKNITGSFCSPHIVCYRDSFHDPTNNQIVIEMNYVQGPTVMEYTQPLRASGNVPLLAQTCRFLTKAMLMALQSIHQFGVIHNDVKPANIIVSTLERVPILVDFGISCFTTPAADPKCTAAYGTVINNCCDTQAGTSYYLPPEATRKTRYPESDLWSLGATIYMLMTGTNIWGLDPHLPAQAIMQEVVNKMAANVEPYKLNSGDPQLDMIVNSFLVYDPASRMSPAQALSML